MCKHFTSLVILCIAPLLLVSLYLGDASGAVSSTSGVTGAVHSLGDGGSSFCHLGGVHSLGDGSFCYFGCEHFLKGWVRVLLSLAIAYGS